MFHCSPPTLALLLFLFGAGPGSDALSPLIATAIADVSNHLNVALPTTITAGFVVAKSLTKNNHPHETINNNNKIVLSEPPTPFMWPIIGNLPEFFARGGVERMNDVYESMYEDYGPVYAMSLMGNNELVISDPRVFDQVLRREGKFPIGGGELVTNFIDYYKDNDLKFAQQMVSRGPEWKEWRQGMNSDMTVLWDTYLPVLAETCADISKIAGREVTETKNLHISEFCPARPLT